MLARAWLMPKLIVLVAGSGAPAAYNCRWPTSVWLTVVTTTCTALAVMGIVQTPATGKFREALARSAGPPEAPVGLRVSARRQGGKV